MLPPPPRSTLFPSRRSSDLGAQLAEVTGQVGGLDRQVHALETPASLRKADSFSNFKEAAANDPGNNTIRSEEHTSELQSLRHLVCRLLLEKKNKQLTQ